MTKGAAPGTTGGAWTREEHETLIATWATGKLAAARIALPHRSAGAISVRASLWSITPAGRYAFLESIQTRTVWPAAEPLVAHRLHQHVNKQSHDGIHAFKSARTRLEYCEDYSIGDKATGPIAVGLVSLWGRVIEHEHGYRAEFAYPRALIVQAGTPNAEQLARALANTYGCEGRVHDGVPA